MILRALWSVLRAASRRGGEGCEAACRVGGARSRARAARAARPRGLAIRRGSVTGRGTTLGADGPESCGAKVEDVALELRALGLETADGAALGLKAFGLVLEGAALGLTELGPVAAAAEPGIGVNTPCAIAAGQARGVARASPTTMRLMMVVMPASPILMATCNARGGLQGRRSLRSGTMDGELLKTLAGERRLPGREDT
jgi:hypothetical protein